MEERELKTQYETGLLESEAAYDDLSKALPKKKLTVDPKQRQAQPIKTKRVMKVATIDEALELSGGFGRF